MEKYTNQFEEAGLRLLSAQPGNKRTANPNLRLLLSPTLYHVTAWLGRINSMVNKALQEAVFILMDSLFQAKPMQWLDSKMLNRT